MALVLVQNPVIVNEGFAWKDIEGEQYHFPNQYVNRCTPGSQFVYYRGSRRPRNRRAAPEYFGFGRIGEVWRDETISESKPKKDWAWYCRVVDYVPFPNPVPAKIDGNFLEIIPKNHWSVEIRKLPEQTLEAILALAGIDLGSDAPLITLPDLKTQSMTEANHPLIVPRDPVATSGEAILRLGRYTRETAKIGRRAEELVCEYLKANASRLKLKGIRWVAREGLTPGWDIEFVDEHDQLNAIEVKGTTGPLFGSIDITIGEWNAALRMADQYWLYLVANCCGMHPVIQRIQNPAQLQYEGFAYLSPTVYRFSLRTPFTNRDPKDQ